MGPLTAQALAVMQPARICMASTGEQETKAHAARLELTRAGCCWLLICWLTNHTPSLGVVAELCGVVVHACTRQVPTALAVLNPLIPAVCTLPPDARLISSAADPCNLGYLTLNAWRVLTFEAGLQNLGAENGF